MFFHFPSPLLVWGGSLSQPVIGYKMVLKTYVMYALYTLSPSLMVNTNTEHGPSNRRWENLLNPPRLALQCSRT